MGVSANSLPSKHEELFLFSHHLSGLAKVYLPA